MSLYSLSANSRNNIGTAASRRLRKINKLVPAIVYGDKIEPEKIQIPHKDLSKALEIEAFYSSIISLSIDGSEQPVILKALQRHPSKPKIIHADFQRASSNSVIKSGCLQGRRVSFLLYTSPSPRDHSTSRMTSSA